MRPTLTVLAPELIDRILDEAKRVLAEVGMEIRGAGDAPAAARGRPADERAGRPRPVPARRRRARRSRRAPRSFIAVRPRRQPARRPRRRPRPFRAGLVGPEGRSTTGPARPASRTRPTSSSTSGSATASHNIAVPRHGVLDQRRHRGPGLRRVAPVHDPDELEEAGRVGRVHRARRRRGWSR